MAEIGTIFIDERLDLTGHTVIGVFLDGCIVELWDIPGGPKTHIENCIFHECQYVGDGWPKPVIVVEI